MKELVVVSGKGGTGKTSLVASLATLAKPVVLADCDVDAPDLHLVLAPRIVRREDFVGGSKARIKPGHCTACGKCEELCRFDAIWFDGPGNGRVARTFRVDTLACEGCGVCYDFCAEDAIQFRPEICGQWFVSETRSGPMVHARLAVAAENSGKLVTQLRRAAQQIAQSKGLDGVICDGSPGIGCPVIASLTGASLALIAAEPTASAMHDFQRIGQLCLRLGVPALLVVNKADLNVQVADHLEAVGREIGIEPVGRVPYDTEVTRAQIAARSVVEVSRGPAAEAIVEIWHQLEERLQTSLSSRGSGLVQLTG
jgi:MinD superfamily P-loop ATPase